MLLDLDQPHEAVVLNEQVVEGLRRARSTSDARRTEHLVNLVDRVRGRTADDAVATARQAIATVTDSLGAELPKFGPHPGAGRRPLDDLDE